VQGEGPRQSTRACQANEPQHSGSSAKAPSFPGITHLGRELSREHVGTEGKHCRCFLGPAQVASLEQASEHQLAPSFCPTCQESQEGSEGRKIDLKGGEGHQHNRTFNLAQTKAHRSLPSLPSPGSAEPAKSRQGAVRRGKGMQHSPGWLLHPHPIFTRVHTDPTLAHLQTTEPRRPTVPDMALHREECWLHAARCSQEQIFKGRRRGWKAARTTRTAVKEVLSLSRLLSLSLFQPPLPVFSPFFSSSAPLNGRVAIPAMRSPADPLTQRGYSFLSMLFHIL